MKNSKTILLSCGVYRTHLYALASGLYSKNKYLLRLLSSAYPKRIDKFIVKFLRLKNGSINRFIDRAENNLNEKYIYEYRFIEFIVKFSNWLRPYLPENKYQIIEQYAYKFYSSFATNKIKAIRPNIYHFRSAYGLKSIDVAKELNSIILCDHSTAHPRYLHDNIFSKEDNFKKYSFMLPILKLMENDINNSENILVNSDFVKSTLTLHKVPDKKIKVIYLGCDSKFLSYNSKNNYDRKEKKSLLFAGGWGKRKGCEYLANALINLNTDLELTIAGSNLEDVKRLTPSLLSSRIKLNILGFVNRKELSELFLQHKIFIFPSLAEGSARVVFEAMSCGCFVITTPNSGSIVKDNINGLLVEPSSTNSIIESLESALQIKEKKFQEISKLNFNLIRSSYTQKNYVENVSKYYDQIS